MNSPEVSLSSIPEAPSPSHQSYRQGSASSSQIVPAEAQDDSCESAYDSDVLYTGAASVPETFQVDFNTGDQSPHDLETSNRKPRGQQQPQERYDRKGSRAYRFEGQIYDGDRSRSPPLDRLRSGGARSLRSREQRRHSRGYSSEDEMSRTNRSINRIVQKRLLERIADLAPYWNENGKLIGVPKGFKVTFNQKSTVLTPMGTQWK